MQSEKMNDKDDSFGKILSNIEQDLRKIFEIHTKIHYKFALLRMAALNEKRKPVIPKATIYNVENINQPKKNVSIKEFCTLFGIGRSTFYKLISEDSGPKLTKIGRRTIIMAEDIEEWKLRLRKK